MSEGKNRKKSDFLAGKGFYIILFACVAVIGISAWVLLFTGNSPAEEVNTRENDVLEASDPISPDGYGVTQQEQWSEDVFASQGTAEVTTPETKPDKKTDTQTEPSPEVTAEPSASAKPSEAPLEDNTPKQKTIEEMTFVWPVAGKIETSFSVEMPVYNKTLAVWRTHAGMDLAASVGTKVLAVADGKVEAIYDDDMMGTTVVIDHGNKLKSVYSNLAETPVVKTGDNVAMGAVIGSVGRTALGEIGEVAHLHLEMMLDGDAVDPAAYLPSR